MEYWNTGLYKEKAVLDFYLTKKQEVSSLFRPDRQFLDEFPEADRYDVVKTTRISVDTLDNQLREHKVSDVDFIKVDTQGSELAVLQGSQAILESSVFGLEIEVEFAPIYEGQPLFSEVDAFVRGLGFHLFDQKCGYWKRSAGWRNGGPRGQLIFADALYFRRRSDFARVLGWSTDEVWKKSKLLRALSICILYGYLDYGLELLREFDRLLSPEEARQVRKRLVSQVGIYARVPNFRGRGRLWALFYSLSNSIRPTYGGWGVIERDLGNF